MGATKVQLQRKEELRAVCRAMHNLDVKFGRGKWGNMDISGTKEYKVFLAFRKTITGDVTKEIPTSWKLDAVDYGDRTPEELYYMQLQRTHHYKNIYFWMSLNSEVVYQGNTVRAISKKLTGDAKLAEKHKKYRISQQPDGVYAYNNYLIARIDLKTMSKQAVENADIYRIATITKSKRTKQEQKKLTNFKKKHINKRYARKRWKVKIYNYTDDEVVNYTSLNKAVTYLGTSYNWLCHNLNITGLEGTFKGDWTNTKGIKYYLELEWGAYKCK